MTQRSKPFLVMAALYLLLGATATLLNVGAGFGFFDALARSRWVTIHLVTIGSITQGLFGLLPLLIASITNRNHLPRGWGRFGQWMLLNTGFPLILAGMMTGNIDITVIGATLILAALLALTYTIYRMTSALDDTTLTNYYRAAPWFLGAGIFLAYGMLLGYHGPGGYFGSIEGHVHANTWGFIALIVAATIQHLLPAILDEPLAHPKLRSVTFWGIVIGASALVIGPWIANIPLTFVGLGIYVIGTGALLYNIVITARNAGKLRDSRLGHILGGYLWMFVPVPFTPFVLLFEGVLPATPIERAAIIGLILGWMLQIAMAFLPSVVTALSETKTPSKFWSALNRMHVRSSWWSVLSLNVGIAFVWSTVFPVLDPWDKSLLLLGYGLVGVPWLVFSGRLWKTLGGFSQKYDVGSPQNEESL